MKKNISRIFAAALAFVMMFTFAPAFTSEAATTSRTIYMTSATSTHEFGIYASNASKVTNIKSSNTKIVKPVRYSLITDTSVDLTNKKKTNSKDASVYFQTKKAGKATVSFTAGKTKYVEKVTVKKYVNPLASLTVSNVNGGKDIHTAYKKGATASGSLKYKAAKQVKVNAKAAKGWQVTRISASNSIYGKTSVYGNASRDYYSKATSASCTISDVYAKGYTYVYVTLRNTKDGGTIMTSLNLSPSNLRK